LCKRFVNKPRTKVYWGVGFTVEEFVAGIQFPFGLEFSPVVTQRQLTFMVELAPRLSFSQSYFVNIQFFSHLGACYYLRTKIKK